MVNSDHLIGFDSIFDKLSGPQYHTAVLTFHITSLREVKTLLLKISVAGFNKKNVDIELKENNLTITCSKKNETPPEDEKSLFTKVLQKETYKTFALAEHVEERCRNRTVFYQLN